CAVASNVLVSRYINRLGAGKTSVLALALMALAMLVWTQAYGSPAVVVVVLGLWSAGSFAAGSAQQIRSVSIDPGVASAAIAINTAMLYGGQALGSSLGGWLIDQRGLAALSHMSLVVLMLAIALSAWLTQRGH